MKVTTPEQFNEAMRAIVADPDKETAHIEADALMMQVLRQLGYDSGVAVFQSRGWWYA